MDRGNSPVNRGELDTAISRHLNFLYDDDDRRTNFSRKEVHPRSAKNRRRNGQRPRNILLLDTMYLLSLWQKSCVRNV